MTCKYYFEDMFCFEKTATVIAVNNEKSSVILDKTIFHVKGGGQLADSGTLNNISVINVFYGENGDILHQVQEEALSQFLINSTVTMRIDSEKRKYHSRLHTAGHLIAGVVEKLYPEIKALSGNHIPNQGRIVFTGALDNKEQFLEEITKELKSEIELNRSVTVAKDQDNIRTIIIDGINSTQCGGTHVKELNEIGSIIIRKVSNKGNQISISYDIN